MSDATTFSADFLARIQALLDASARTASPVVGMTFSRDDWRMDAPRFIETWNATRMCTVGSASRDGKPHLAAIHAAFGPDGRLTMRMFDQSVRQRDFAENPRVALQKVTPEGAVMTVYGKPKVVEGSLAPGRGGTGPGTWEVEIEPTRIYAMQPQGRG